MSCEFCNGTGGVTRVRECGSVVDVVTCPRCVRGVKILGTHEMLKDHRGDLHRPGQYVEALSAWIIGALREEAQ